MHYLWKEIMALSVQIYKSCYIYMYTFFFWHYVKVKEIPRHWWWNLESSICDGVCLQDFTVSCPHSAVSMWKTIHRSLLVSKHACIHWAQNLLPSTWHMWYIIVPGDSRLIYYISSKRISSALASGKKTTLYYAIALKEAKRLLRGNRELSHWNTVGKHRLSH